MYGALAENSRASLGDAAIDAAWSRAVAALHALYGESTGFSDWLHDLKAIVLRARHDRPSDLKAWDLDNPPEGWWRQGRTIGYSTYVDRFGGTFAGVEARLDHLSDLGVTYLHLLPFMKPRAGESDGGYAVADFEDVNADLGDREALKSLLAAARARGIQVVSDLVCNHVADDHTWAQAARRGEPGFSDFFHTVDTRAEVEAWEASLQDVFPDSAPGNFTWSDELGAWVWTSFYPYQWDLNYAEPKVFTAMTSSLLNLANLGLGGFRLDSTGFLWKRKGTNCRNLPEVHLILAAWRAILNVAAPGGVLKAEAIDRLEEVLPFFGDDDRPECDLAYGNGVMAGSWASLALGDAVPVTRMIAAGAVRPSHGAWVNYVRCHDDVIFSGLSPYVSRTRQAQAALALTRQTPERFGTGEVFQTFDGVSSINGMAASLTGADDPNDPSGVDRLLLLYGICFGLDGAPVIFMGDEIALGNDESYRDDPKRAGEGRWLGRPMMDWAAVDHARSGDVQGSAGRMLTCLKRLASVRRDHPAFQDLKPVVLLDGQSETVLAFERGNEDDRLIVAANFGDRPAHVATGLDHWMDLVSDEAGTGAVMLKPWGLAWLAGRS